MEVSPVSTSVQSVIVSPYEVVTGGHGEQSSVLWRLFLCV